MYYSNTTTATSYNIPVSANLTANKTYYWNVRAYGADWGPGMGERTIVFNPPYATPSSPANGSSFQNNYVDSGWNTAIVTSGATLSRYDVRDGKTFGGTDILPVTSNGTSTTKRISVPPGTAGNTTIYWQVRVVDSNGYAGPWKESTVIYSNDVPKITATTNTPANLDVSLEKRHHQLSINSLIDPDNFNYVTLYADILDKNGVMVPGSKKQIVLDSSLMGSPTALIKGTGTEKDGSLQGPFNIVTPFNLQLYLEPDFVNGTFDLSLVKSDGVTNVLKSGAKLISKRTMQKATDASPESFTLRIYPEDRQNTDMLANSPLASVPDVTPITMAFTSDTRNYLPHLTNVKDDVAERIFSDSQGFNKISVTGHVDDYDPADSDTIYYEVQPKAATYSIATKVSGGKTVPANGKAGQTFSPKVNNDFSFTYQIGSNLDSGDYALLVYGYDSQQGIGDVHAIPFTVDRGGPTIDFTANYLTSGGQTIVMSSAQKQIVAQNNKAKLYFTPNNYATFEYAGYLIRGGAVNDLRIRGAFTNDIKATFIGVDFGQDPITLMNGTQTSFQLGDVIVFKFKATSSTGIVTEKDVRILIGDDTSTFTPLDDANLPAIP